MTQQSLQPPVRRNPSARVVFLWGAAALLCGARLVQLVSIVLGEENGPAHCKPEQRGDVVLTVDARNYSEWKYIPLRDFLQGPNLERRVAADHRATNKSSSSANEPAVCEWPATRDQFASAMEHLYRCWSYWQHFPDARWVLYRPPARHHLTPHGGRQHQPNNAHMRFVEGLIDILEDHVHVTSDPGVLANAVRRRPGSGAFQMASPHDARSLVSLVRTALGIPSMTDGRNSTQREPRIALLNRRVSQKRAILNADRLVRRIGKELQLPQSHHDATNSTRVEMTYFEDKSFREQLEFFLQHDIIISPHGAQLSGLAFLPECSAVLEVFPAHYQNHRYFGSLVASAGLAHYSFGVGDRAVPTLSVSERETRIVRQVQLCPSRVAIVEGVRRMAEDWKECRRRVQLRSSEVSYAA